ncbi:TPT1 [Symbiodinium natans]|uniref:TPT1 protein n=1 Tax=Symbiodinium natans TaxID=878477 RepID=A0A812LEW0_9DINO|nr:TPT1 [Symbiodinium natans]
MHARNAGHAAMFGTNGFVKVSDRNWGRPAACEGLRKIRSDPVLPRIAEARVVGSSSARKASVAETDIGSIPQASAGAKRGTVFRPVASLLPPASVEEVTNAALASIEDIRSSLDHFQGRSSADKEAICDEPSDLREDLRHRLARYRYTRRIEPPPPPLAMDPAFEPAPPRPMQAAAVQVMSSSCLRSFQPQRRRAQLAEQAEHRRLRLESAKTKRELTHQELEEKTMADMDRYIQRMEQYELEKNSSRAGGQESFVEAEQGQLQSRLTTDAGAMKREPG